MSTITTRMLLATSLLIVSAAAPRPALAQPDPTTAAAHALVLSGGGARGLAHAGSIVALEQLGYDPSLVVGTSMGAIVGALYAAGYSSADVRDFVAAENWLERFSAAAVPFGRTRVPLRPVLGVGISRGRFYEGLVPATGVNLRLVQLLFDAGARARNDFDRLPRRFRAVAADLGTGAEVVLSAGDLPRAVRASMAVPGVFAPILWDGRVLADGGLANNLPISVAAALTDAPIFAVDVLHPAALVDERSSLDLGIRALRLLIANAQPDSIVPDILVLPRIGAGLGDARFPSDASTLLEAGRVAVLEQVPAAVPAQSGSRREPGAPPRTITALRINADDAATARLVRRIMMPAVGAYDAAAIIRRTAALYGTGLFQAVWPWLDFDVDGDVGAATLVIDVTPVARTGAAAALRWDDDTGGAGWATLTQRLAITTPVELRAGVLLTELGHAASVELSAFSSILPGVIWNAGVHAGDHRVRLFSADTLSGQDLHRRAGGWAGAELHGPVSDWFISAVGRAEHLRRESGDGGWGYGPYLRLAPAPRVDRVVGVEPIIEWETRVGEVAYSRGHVRLSGERRLGPWRTAVLGDLHGTTRGAPADVRPAAMRDLAPWLAAGRLRGRATATAGVDAAHPIVLDGFVRLRLRAFGMVTGPDARAADLRTADAWQVGGELGAIWPTVIGPVTAGIAASRSDWRINISIGANGINR